MFLKDGGTPSGCLDCHEDVLSDMELLRVAFPRRVFSLSQTKFLIDRVHWLFENRKLVGGLKFINEPEVLRFFMGRLAPVNDWPQKLVEKFKKDFDNIL